MIQDQLILGPITFDSYSTPDIFSVGGKQQLIVHKLPGGSRVIDELGPDEMDIVWRGHFFGDNAYATARQLDALRISGAVLALSFAGQGRTVIIADFIYSIRRLPLWVEYVITCTVVTHGPNTGPSGSAVQNQVTSDLGNANADNGNPFGPFAMPPSTMPGGTPVWQSPIP
jgi:hypothetical protein